MPRKKKVIEVTYVFDVEYEHENHLEDIKKDLKKGPEINMQGAGIVGKDRKAYSFSCRMRKNSGILNY